MDTPSKIAYTVTADSTGGRAGTSAVPALGITHVMRMPKELGGPGDGANPEALFAFAIIIKILLLPVITSFL